MKDIFECVKLRYKIKSKQKALAIAICLMISNSAFAEKYRLDFPNTSHGGTSCNTTWCGSYFDSGFIELSSNGSNSSKIKIRFMPNSVLERENEAYVYILTLAYDAAVTDISFGNINPIGVIPAQASEEEKKSAIPGAITSYAEGVIVSKLPGIVGKALPYVKIAAATLEPIQLSREPSMLSVLTEDTILDRELYPYHSYYQFFNRFRNVTSTVTFTINKPLNTLNDLIRTKKMSVYIGGDRENEVLIEGVTRLEEVSEGSGGNETSWVTGAYTNNQDINKILTIQGASTLAVTVNGETERRYDFVWIYDENNRLIKKLDGDINTTFNVAGSSIKARLTTDRSNTRSGVTVTVAASDEEVTPIVELVENGRWISSGGRNPNTFRNIKYDFTLENASDVTINLDTTRDNDAYLYLLNSQGEVVASDDDAGGDRDSRINNQSLNAGNYTIIAATYDIGMRGDFTLSLTGPVSNFHRNLP